MYLILELFCTNCSFTLLTYYKIIRHIVQCRVILQLPWIGVLQKFIYSENVGPLMHKPWPLLYGNIFLTTVQTWSAFSRNIIHTMFPQYIGMVEHQARLKFTVIPCKNWNLRHTQLRCWTCTSSFDWFHANVLCISHFLVRFKDICAILTFSNICNKSIVLDNNA